MLCGRHALSLGVDVDLDVLGVDRDRLCGSCWRIAEGCLELPGPAEGEDLVLVWLVETVVKDDSAMIDDVPFGRVRPLCQRVTRQIRATIGGKGDDRADLDRRRSWSTQRWSSTPRPTTSTTGNYRKPCCASGPAKQDFHSANRTGGVVGHKSPVHQAAIIQLRQLAAEHHQPETEVPQPAIRDALAA